MGQTSGRASVVKTIIAVIFSPSIYRKQTLPSCSLPVAENRQAQQMSRDGGGVLQLPWREAGAPGSLGVGTGRWLQCCILIPNESSKVHLGLPSQGSLGKSVGLDHGDSDMEKGGQVYSNHQSDIGRTHSSLQLQLIRDCSQRLFPSAELCW